MKTLIITAILYIIVFGIVFWVNENVAVGPCSSPVILVPALFIFIICTLFIIFSIVELVKKKSKESLLNVVVSLVLFSVLLLYLYKS